MKKITVLRKVYSKIKTLNFTKWITLLSAIGTLAAAIGTFATIHYINKQNQLSIKPEILINDENMIFLIEKYENNYVNLYTSNTTIDTTCFFYYKGGNVFLIHPDIRTNSFRFHLVNVGLGVAKNISLSWSIDTTSFLKIINKNKVPFITSVISKDRRIIVNNKKDTNYYWDIPERNAYRYLLPYSESKEVADCKLPLLFLKMYTIFEVVDGYMKMDTNTMDGIKEEFPDLILKIAYSDITENDFTQTYKVKLEDGSSAYAYDSKGWKGMLNKYVVFKKEK